MTRPFQIQLAYYDYMAETKKRVKEVVWYSIMIFLMAGFISPLTVFEDV